MLNSAWEIEMDCPTDYFILYLMTVKIEYNRKLYYLSRRHSIYDNTIN